MLQDLSRAQRNSSRDSSKLVPETLRIMAIFSLVALAAIVFASHTIATQANVDPSTLYGP